MTNSTGKRRPSGAPTTPLVSIILPCYNSGEYLERCLRSLRATAYPRWELVLIDDGSTDGALEEAQRRHGGDRRLRFLWHASNRGAAAARMTGARAAKGTILVFFDSDATVEPDWLDPLVGALRSPEVGAAQSRMLQRDGRTVTCIGERIIPYAGWIVLLKGDANDPPSRNGHGDRWVLASSGSIAVKRDVYRLAGGFDGGMLFNQFEDLDFSFRIWLSGHRIVSVPESVVYHDAMEKGAPPERYRLIQYASQRNCLRMLLKNYSAGSLALYLPTALGAMAARGLYALFRRGELAPLVGLAKGVAYNAAHLPSVLRERRRVQRKVRRVPDRHVWDHVAVRVSPWRVYRDYLSKGRGY